MMFNRQVLQGLFGLKLMCFWGQLLLLSLLLCAPAFSVELNKEPGIAERTNKARASSDPLVEFFPNLRINKYKPYPQKFDVSLLKKGSAPLIRVSANKFVDPEGKVFMFRGMSMQDPDSLVQPHNRHSKEFDPNFKRQHFKKMVEWGANIIRVPVHPISWRWQGREGYFKLLDQLVIWANESGVYLIIDWHAMGDITTGEYQGEKYRTSAEETAEFWRNIAYRYQGINNVAFYELFNEPTTFKRLAEPSEWLYWKELYEKLIDQIRVFDSNVIPLVSGLDWSYDLSLAARLPVQREGVAYAFHPFPQKIKEPNIKHLEKEFSSIFSRYPKQFFGDRVGNVQTEDGNVDFEWWFQDFTDNQSPRVKGLGDNEIRKFKLRERLCKSPKSKQSQPTKDIVRASLRLGRTDTLKTATKSCELRALNRVKAFSAVRIG